MFDKKAVKLHFERAVETYDASAVLQKEIAKRLTERLDYIKHTPKTVLDAGSGTGYVTRDILQRYPKSAVIALDLAHSMADKSRQHGGWFKKPLAVCADAEQLPIKPDSIELLISNLMLQWSNDINQTFNGFQSVLAPNGLLLFSTFGSETLHEMRESWEVVDQQPHTSDFLDMHEIGDAMLQAGFLNPVTDMEMITMTYANVRQLMRDIKRIGASNTISNRSKGLMGKNKLTAFEKAYEQFKTDEGLYPASWEVIYGHAWAGEGLKLDDFEKVIQIHKGISN